MYQRQCMFVFMVQLPFCCNINVFTQPHTGLCGDINETWSLFVVVFALSRYLSSSVLMLCIRHKHMLMPKCVLLFHCCMWFIAKKNITHVLSVWNTADKVFSVWVKVIGVMLTCNMTNLGQCNHPPPSLPQATKGKTEKSKEDEDTIARLCAWLYACGNKSMMCWLCPGVSVCVCVLGYMSEVLLCMSPSSTRSMDDPAMSHPVNVLSELLYILFCSHTQHTHTRTHTHNFHPSIDIFFCFYPFVPYS